MRDPLNKREEIEETNKQISNLETKLRDIQHLMKTPDYKNIIKRSLISDGYYFDSQENLMEYYNENGKFDYYDIGGRWQNTLKKENEYGKVSLCNCCKIDELHMYQTDEEKEFLTRKWNFIVNDIDDGIDFENKDDCKVNKEYIKNAFLRDYGTLETYIDSSIIDPPTAMVTSLGEWLEFEELDTKDACEKFLEARELAEKNPYVSIADWNKVAKEHPEIWAGTDQVHFGNDSNMIEEGAKLYAETIAAAVKAAQELPVKSK